MDARPASNKAHQDTNSTTNTEVANEAFSDQKQWQLPIPRYLEELYTWAYIAPFAHWLFDRQWIVSLILWFNDKRLMKSVLDEIKSGDRVYMPASVYGDFCPDLARKAAPGTFMLSDISTVQLLGQRKKRRKFKLNNMFIRRANAANPVHGPYDVAISFLLLHEVPEDYKHAIINRLLDEVDTGGKAIFIDYHKMAWWHPLWPIMAFIAWWLEPYTFTLWEREIQNYATQARQEQFKWSKTTSFGGLYQKIVATRVKDRPKNA